MCLFMVLLCFPTDSDFENANRSADVDVELMAFQSIIGDDYKGDSEIRTLAQCFCLNLLF